MENGLKPWPADARLLDQVIIAKDATFRGYVAAVPRKHGCLQYTFTPIGPAELATAEQAIAQAVEKERESGVQVMATVIAKHVKWTAATGGPLSREQALTICDPVFHRVWHQMSGAVAMDEGYDWDPAPTEPSKAQQLLDSANADAS